MPGAPRHTPAPPARRLPSLHLTVATTAVRAVAALLALERLRPDVVLVVPAWSGGADESRAGLLPGERMRVRFGLAARG